MAKPFIDEKNVVLCRSGIQMYRSNELIGLNLINDKPSSQPDKMEYRIMRHKAPIIEAKEKFRRLPLTKEHPPVDVTPDNWKHYAHGSTGSFVDVTNLEGGDIGLASDLVFNTNEIYNYYLDGNREVSVGYTNTHRWVDNHEEVGYDIELVSIGEVNHVAVTRMGRGGSQVSIIDSLIGGIRMLKFKSGIFGFLGKKGSAKDSVVPFSKTVFDSVEKAQKMGEKEVEAVLATLTDSLASLKETDTRKTLCDSVADLLAAPSLAMEKKEELSSILDSLYEKAEKETVSAFDSDTEDSDTEDTDPKAEEEKKTEDTDPKAEEKKEEVPAKDEDGKGKGTANISDSLVATVQKTVQDSFQALADELRESYGLPKKQAKGGAVTTDSAPVSNIRVSEFID